MSRLHRQQFVDIIVLGMFLAGMDKIRELTAVGIHIKCSDDQDNIVVNFVYGWLGEKCMMI
jgi:hypothetical protein